MACSSAAAATHSTPISFLTPLPRRRNANSKMFSDSFCSSPISIISTAAAAGAATATGTLRRSITRKASSASAATSEIQGRRGEVLWDLEKRKHHLLGLIQETQRGLVTTADQRSSIEEALVTVEGYDAGVEIELDRLNGTWRLQYTSAPDVLVLFDSAERLPFLEVGQIYQKFECGNPSHSDGGIVCNIVKWSIAGLLEEQDGATLVVSAKFSVVSQRNIYLEFGEISLQNVNISEELQALIAPALLPRSFLSLQILQFIRTFKAQIPVRSLGRQQSVGGLYYLSYLDDNLLLGRAVDGGGVFVFSRAQQLL